VDQKTSQLKGGNVNPFYLVVVDTAQIQPYIFASNRLRENVGASYLVRQVTGQWALQALRSVAPKCNLDQDIKIADDQRIEDGAIDAEVIYSGGGNFLALFRQEEAADAFARALSLKALRDAPGLQLVIVRHPYTWGENLYDAVAQAFKKLEQKKRNQRFSAPLAGLGITEACRSTGLPAAQMSPKIAGDASSTYPVSAEVAAKLAVVKEANDYLNVQCAAPRQKLEERLGARVAYPLSLDHLGRSHEEFSYIAVMHIDGNQIGERILKAGKSVGANPREYIRTQREFSQKMETAGLNALNAALLEMVAAVDPTERGFVQRAEDGVEVFKFELPRNPEGGFFLPVRPLVFGGDDFALVCDGRLGVSLATAFMRNFAKKTGEASLPDKKGQASACAGIAIVKTHYPFAQAYELAEELCRSAKQYRHEVVKQTSQEVTCLDWYFAQGGLYGNLEVMRKREYKVSAGELTLRPVTLEERNPRDLERTWAVVRNGTLAFQGPDWRDRHNKVKDLREALRGGEVEVRAFLLKYARKDDPGLPNIVPQKEDFKLSGWAGKRCGYFDAIELADWLVDF